MQIATLLLAGIGAATGVASLLIMAKTARELQDGKHKIEAEVAEVKTKGSRNAAVVKAALSQLEL